MGCRTHGRDISMRVAAASSVIAIATLLLLLASASVFALGDTTETACINEGLTGFQAYLPDCRAYEMVSPPSKAGAQVTVLALSADGSHVIVDSIGAFAGTESDPLNGARGAVYDFARTKSGWVASPVTPPARLTPDAQLFGVSIDAVRALWEVVGTPGSVYAANLDVREPNGTLADIGPLLPPAGAAGPPAGTTGGLRALVAFAGASDDLSHVLFNIAAVDPTDLWPGDTTAPETTARSLYEYVGAGNTRPILVGQDDEGRLISSCETALGSVGLPGGGDAYNAVSATGETVFFTAIGHDINGCSPLTIAPEVGELYARLNQLQTVAISEPLHSQCKECNTPATVALGRRPAVFQGASQDGAKVLFLTTQELFPGNSTTNLYEYDFNNLSGEKIVRVSVGSPTPEVRGVARMSEDGSHIYFVAKGVLTGVNSEGKSPVLGANNLYVYERDSSYPGGRTAFIATLSSETETELVASEAPCQLLSGEQKEECEAPFRRDFERRNRADAGDWSQRDSRPVQATPDGRFLVFESVADLTPGDTSAVPQVFEYDALREKLVRISVGAVDYKPGAVNADTNSSSISSQSYAEVSAPTAASTKLAVTDDGSRVLFASRGALTPDADTAAANGVESVYEYRSMGSIENGNVYLLSSGTNLLSAEIAGLDASGDDIFFQTADPLLPTDVDTQFDLYDARIRGGFPLQPMPATCEGDTCQGMSLAPPALGAPGSIVEPGGENLTVPVEAKPLRSTPKLAKPKHKPKKKPKKVTKIKTKKSRVDPKGKR